MTDRSAIFHEIVSGRRRGISGYAARAVLWWLRLAYGVGIWWRNRRWDRRGGVPVGVPVVSVGNLTLGGTGKTPCVEWLARHYRAEEVQVAILSRGYGADDGRNDEALVLEENLPDVPHLHNPDRVAAAVTAVSELESELLILDDGFQHRRIARTCDIVLIDATNPFGHGYLFPRGLLREPLSSLRRAHAVLLSRCDQVSTETLAAITTTIRRTAAALPIFRTVHRPRGADELNGRSVAAFCGIGNPEAFRRTLTALGAQVQAMRTFPDHHAYTRSDIDDLTAWGASFPDETILVTTQKDHVKIRTDRLGTRPLRRVAVELAFVDADEEAAFRALLPTIDPTEF